MAEPTTTKKCTINQSNIFIEGIVVFILAFILSPGLLLTIPPSANSPLFGFSKEKLLPALVHALVASLLFMAVFYFMSYSGDDCIDVEDAP
jgi:hypothetical protein